MARTRQVFIGIVVVLAGFLAACDCDDANHVLECDANQPPMIVEWGPDAVPDVIDVLPRTDHPQCYVVVADPDGLDDVSAALFSVDSIGINRLIARPDSQPSVTCARLIYTDFDTVAIMPLIALAYPGPFTYSMDHVQAGLYAGPRFCAFDTSCAIFPDIPSLNESIGRRLTGCLSYPLGDFLDQWSLHPPLVDSLREVFVTYADVDFIGLSTTVWDGAGDSASVRFPDLHIRYSANYETWTEP